MAETTNGRLTDLYNSDKNRQLYAYDYNLATSENPSTNWGQNASRSLYSVFGNQQDTAMKGRSLINSRLWHGVPQLTSEQMNLFEAAHTGHTFIFVVDVPKFMTTGIYQNKNLHYQMKNLKAIIERASTGFDGASNIVANLNEQEDGNGRKLSHVTSVTKEQNDISLTLHEFAGLPVKNALEAWITGTYDYKSEHGHYFGNLGIPGGWCLANHTMSILVVQVDPSWQVIQDAAYYYNMFPTEVPFEHFSWRKGEHNIVDDYTISFRCNEERSPMITYAAEKYMNNRILSMVATSVYNSRQFVISDFRSGTKGLDEIGYENNISDASTIIDKNQFNINIAGSQYNNTTNSNGEATDVAAVAMQRDVGSTTLNRYSDVTMNNIDSNETVENYKHV